LAQITQAEFPLTEDYTAPKGALLMPSLIAASMQVTSCSYLQDRKGSLKHFNHTGGVRATTLLEQDIAEATMWTIFIACSTYESQEKLSTGRVSQEFEVQHAIGCF
jgi:hypothetical protein